MSKESIYKIMRAKMKASVKAYLKAREKFDAEPTPANRDKERLLRGIVRGQAMMLLTFFRPSQHSNKHEVESIEYEFGFPHDNDANHYLPEKSPTMIEYARRYD